MGDLYETDFIAWTEQQAGLLRAEAARRSNAALDWMHVAEEIEDLGRSRADALASQLRRLMLHLLKLEHSTARLPRAGWRDSVRDARAEIESLLESDPGLRPRVAGLIAREWPRAARLAAEALEDFNEDASAIRARLRAGGVYPEARILSAWFPPDALAD